MKDKLFVIIIALMLLSATVQAEEVRNVQADNDSKAAGIDSFAVSSTESGGDRSLFVQVVGTSTAASGVEFVEVTNGVRASITMSRGGASLQLTLQTSGAGTVTRDGSTIASWSMDTSGTFVSSGLEALANDSGWVALGHTLRDANLYSGLLAEVPIVPPQAATNEENCDTNCRNAYPMPADCAGAWDEYQCCIAEANYDHCRRVCKCDFIETPTVGNVGDCIVLATYLFTYEGLGCAGGFL